MNKLAIVGSGDLGQLMAHHALASGYEVVGFYDDFKNKGELIAKKTPILGKIIAIETDFEAGVFDKIIVGIGYKHLHFKEKLILDLQQKAIPLANIIHPSAYIDSSVTLGEGLFILPRCVIDAGGSLADGVLLNTGVCIAHHTHIGFCTFIAPSAALAGFIQIGKRCFIGINSTVIDNISVIDDVQIGAGAVITKTITEKGLYVGIPAKKIK